MSNSSSLVPLERIQHVIFLFRGEKVMLDADIAALYSVKTKVLLQAMRRNSSRFPVDFVFQLSREEAGLLRSQTVTSDITVREGRQSLRSQAETSKPGRGGRRYLPYAFTEQGVAMLSSILRSKRAIEVNIAIMRAFVSLRRLLADNAALAKKLDELERKVIGHDSGIRSLFDAIRQLTAPRAKPRREMGFHAIAKTRAAQRRNSP